MNTLTNKKKKLFAKYLYDDGDRYLEDFDDIEAFLFDDVKSAVEGLLKDIEKIKLGIVADYENGWCDGYLKDHCVDIAEKLKDLIKKWFKDVI